LTEKLDEDFVQDTVDAYSDQASIDGRIARTAAEVEGEYYGKLTRVEETVLLVKRLGVNKVGIASCLGLANEAAAFAEVLEVNGIDYIGVTCKVGSQDKIRMGLDEDKKVRPGRFEGMCNPMLQAKVFNKERTDFNIIIGLCAGHDSIFARHSDAPVTTLIVKDRVLAHNPVACLYGMDFYYNRLKKPLKD